MPPRVYNMKSSTNEVGTKRRVALLPMMLHCSKVHILRILNVAIVWPIILVHHLPRQRGKTATKGVCQVHCGTLPGAK